MVKERKMAENKGFRELKVWQRGKKLAVKVYEISGKGKFNSDYGLRDQVRRVPVHRPPSTIYRPPSSFSFLFLPIHRLPSTVHRVFYS